MQNTECRTEYRIRNAEYRMQNTEYRIQNTKYIIQTLMDIKLPMFPFYISFGLNDFDAGISITWAIRKS
jgi:hypothetical protein